jgi:Ser/Thr protein kinase RdoA (MazF antagonist)
MPIPGILKAFGFDETQVSVNSFGSGLINNTWMVASGSNNYILQRINQNVFKDPQAIADNIDNIGNYLAAVHPLYKFTMPVTTVNGPSLLYIEGEGYFRMFLFVEGSHSKDVVETPEQAFEAAAQFGRFSNFLSGFDVTKLKSTIPNFHNLSLRYSQFLQALDNGNPERIKESTSLINILQNHGDIVTTYESITRSRDFKLRVTHHDTKISNVLFDGDDKGLCVIDLDTVMPGYFISDVGDMMRTYLSPVSEEEKDYNKIEIREDFYKAVVQGYYTEMKDELTEAEKKHFFYAAAFLLYMQALRFLTDHLNNDVYYGAKYCGNNFVRANNQIVLLQRLIEKKEKLENIL